MCLLLEIPIFFFFFLLSKGNNGVQSFRVYHFPWISSSCLSSTVVHPTLLLTPPEGNPDRIQKSITTFLPKSVPRQNSPSGNAPAKMEMPYWLECYVHRHVHRQHTVTQQNDMTSWHRDVLWQLCTCDRIRVRVRDWREIKRRLHLWLLRVRAPF